MDKHSAQVLKKTDEELQQRLQKDFIVKNMPAFTSFSGASYDSPSQKSNHSSQPVKERNQPSHKSVGLIIIGSGILVVLIIFYLAYRFLILPAMNTKSNAGVEETVQKETPAVVIPEVIAVPTSTELVVVPVETSVATTTPEIPAELILPLVADADNEGLSDAAEVFLGTNPQAADTDNDNYSDKQEILGGYNPVGAGKLADNRNLALYTNPDRAFAVVYPQDWSISVAGQNSTLFSAPDNSFIQISYEDSEQNQPDILAWYRGQFSDFESLDSSRFIESSFGPGVMSADGQIAYFLDADGRHVFVLSYIKSGESAAYLDVFKMMVATMMTP